MPFSHVPTFSKWKWFYIHTHNPTHLFLLHSPVPKWATALHDCVSDSRLGAVHQTALHGSISSQQQAELWAAISTLFAVIPSAFTSCLRKFSSQHFMQTCFPLRSCVQLTGARTKQVQDEDCITPNIPVYPQLQSHQPFRLQQYM